MRNQFAKRMCDRIEKYHEGGPNEILEEFEHLQLMDYLPKPFLKKYFGLADQDETDHR